MRRKLLFLSVLALISAMLFAACTPDLSVEPEEPAATEEAAPEGLSGQIQIAGSTTVQPLAEALAEAFTADDMNPDVTIEVQGGGSSVGVTSAGEGTVDIGNTSRNVKESEFEEFPELKVYTIAFDGIAIVTNPDLELPSLSIDQVNAIFAGEITNYSEVGGPDAEIVVVSREEGSGTRAALEELVMESGDREAEITENALLQQSNGQVRTTVAETPNTIAYVSFGFLDESVNTVAIGGVEPSVANVKNGSYSIFRPLNMLTNGDPIELSKAFLDFILSADGQAIVAEEFISVTDEDGMEEDQMEEEIGLTGTIQIAGSTTVQPLAEQLAEGFTAVDLNPDVTIEVQGGGSSVGVTSAGEGTVDIGNTSRNVKESEFEEFPELQVYTIAFDGIAIVTNPDLELPSLSIDQVKAIFASEITNYSEVGGPDAEIIVVSREEGSGTRAAFEELVMESGDTEAEITENALLQQSNGQVRTTVAETPNTIAYVSFGFLDESVNTVATGGVEPSVANVKNGSYSIFRPLNMLTNGEPGDLAQAFLNFILSADGQAIVAEDYITVTEEEGMEEEAYTPPTGLEGQLQVAGSTTVQPLAESLAEAFTSDGLNPDLTIEIQGGGSSVGVTSAGEGTVDIGNASRNIKDSEFETFPDLQVFTIAFDGIAIVTNPDLELPSFTIKQVQQIFAGEITNFSEVGGPDAEIVVVSREEGSGTRAAFEELVMEYNDSEALITEDALLQQSNGQVRTTVAETPNTIAYISFGFLDESVNTVAINDVEPTVDNVKSGDYSIFRPLNMLTNGEPSELAQAFLDFILSDMGQEVVAEEYITVK